MPRKSRRQYLLTLQVSWYCLLALQSIIHDVFSATVRPIISLGSFLLSRPMYHCMTFSLKAASSYPHLSREITILWFDAGSMLVYRLRLLSSIEPAFYKYNLCWDGGNVFDPYNVTSSHGNRSRPMSSLCCFDIDVYYTRSKAVTWAALWVRPLVKLQFCEKSACECSVHGLKPPESGGHCHLIYLTILAWFSGPSLAYICTNVT